MDGIDNIISMYNTILHETVRQKFMNCMIYNYNKFKILNLESKMDEMKKKPCLKIDIFESSKIIISYRTVNIKFM